MSAAVIRFARPDDLDCIIAFIAELAAFEQLADQVKLTRQGLSHHLFGPVPRAEVLIAELGGQPQGFALFFHNFSTFTGKPGLYVEDLYVRPDARGQGIGSALLAEVAALAVARDCGRMEWWVLDWNRQAIRLYGAIGAEPMSDWTVQRLSGDKLTALAAKARGVSPLPVTPAEV